MDYELWREDLFGQSPDSDPVWIELLPETYELDAAATLDFVDRSLVDPAIHVLYSKPQIGLALLQFYSNNCSDFPFCYIEGTDESRRLKAIRNLQYLYSNYFERYCTGAVTDIGNDQTDGNIGYLCYMLWDIFVLYPGNASTAMVEEAINVMDVAIHSENDQCITSAIHGLGHWVLDTPLAKRVLNGWLRSPSTRNPVVIEYAKIARTGIIL